MSSIQVDQSRKVEAARADIVRDLVDLTKPRITSMVLITVALAQFVAGHGVLNWLTLAHTLIGTLLVGASSGAFNQWLERDTDALMRRTWDRPLPSGRMGLPEVLGLGIGSLVLGVGYLSVAVGWQPTMWAVATWAVYVCIYTPMKQYSSWNTAVGAVSGALPILIGWSAVSSTWDWWIVTMFGVLFLWQFPHFIAIAWIYRQQYSRAGLQMVTVTDPSGRWPGIYAVAGAVVLMAFSLLPMLQGLSWVYLFGALTLGCYQIIAAWQFRRQLNDAAARNLLKASIIYLPLTLGLIAVQSAL